MDFKTIAQKFYSDKVKLYDVNNKNWFGHCYDITYSKIFQNLDRNKKLKILEIGIGLGDHYNGMKNRCIEYTQGASLKLWAEFFPNSKIVGWDIYHCDNIPNYNIETYVLDATNKYDIDKFFNNNNYKFDIIIDDGSHYEEHQVKSFMYLHEHLEKDGFYIIEDILGHNIEKFKTLQPFPTNFLEEVINKNFEVCFYDTRKESGDVNDFIICFKKINN
jgi:hypothetical protein